MPGISAVNGDPATKKVQVPMTQASLQVDACVFPCLLDIKPSASCGAPVSVDSMWEPTPAATRVRARRDLILRPIGAHFRAHPCPRTYAYTHVPTNVYTHVSACTDDTHV